MGAGAVALVLGPIDDLAALESPLRVPWPLLAAAFALAEVFAVHLHFRRDAHTLTMSDLPLVLGLFMIAPQELVLAQVAGGLVALVIALRQPALKAAFNLAQLALGSAIAVMVFRAGPWALDVHHWTGWAMALVATLVASAAGILATSTAIQISDGDRVAGRLRKMFGFGLAVTAANTALALSAVAVLWTAPQWAWLLLIPTAVLIGAYRAYTSMRQKHEGLSFLYEATRVVHGSPLVESAITTLLIQAREMFHAERAEITLLLPEGRGEALRTSSGPGDRVEVMTRVNVAPSERLLERPLITGRSMLLARPIATEAMDVADSLSGIKDAIAAPLEAEHGVIGVLVISDRLGDVDTFDEDDLKLCETLASHLSIALENSRLGQSLAQLQELEARLRHQAMHDPLTGLPNRWLFMDRVEQGLIRRELKAGSIAVLFVDIDDFKTVNDSLGHAAGDDLLRGVADRLLRSLRPEDSAARLGGDEFAILIDEPGAAVAAHRVARRVIEELGEPLNLQGRDVFVRASIGIAVAESRGEAAEDLLRNADVAMYMAKDNGKHRYEFFDPSMHTAAVERLELKDDLQRAIGRAEMVVHYQPIVDLRTAEITGAEALVRWAHPSGALVEPDVFVPLAEETGLITEIDRLVLKESCLQAARWRASFPDRPLTMSVNLSARQLQRPDLVEVVVECLEEAGIDAADLTLELTEGTLMADTALSATVLRNLKDLGVQLAIDDFGTGHSSLAYLRHFPFDILKIDKSFIDGIAHGGQEGALAKAIVELGGSLQLVTVAEGVEASEQNDMLVALGCNRGQGFFFGQPGPPEMMDALLGGDAPRLVVRLEDPVQPRAR